MKLTADNVEKVLKDCMFQAPEPIRGEVHIEGVNMRVYLKKDQVLHHTTHIYTMLKQLPEDFQLTGGGGATFMNMCVDREGEQWADLHETMDKLVVLGIACGKVKFCMPREMWSVLPGGMPYIQVL